VVNQFRSASVSPLFVGIDVGGEFLDVAYHGYNEHYRLADSAHGIADLIGRLMPLQSERVVLEATGKLERTLLS
jgi:transposase